MTSRATVSHPAASAEAEIHLSGPDLVQAIVQDLKAPGMTPVIAAGRALSNHLVEQFTAALGDRLKSAPKVRGFSTNLDHRCQSLATLCNTGAEWWYVEVQYATAFGLKIPQPTLSAQHIELIPIRYGGGVERTIQVSSRTLKQQVNHILRINHVRVTSEIFGCVLAHVKNELPPQPWMANFAPGPQIHDFRFVSFDHMVSGARMFCGCARDFHTDALKKIREYAPQYARDSWPHAVITLLSKASYEEALCHLCIARHGSIEEANGRYGESIEFGFESYLDQVVFDLGVDRATALAEIKQLLGLSRWVREAELYRIVRNLFPGQHVLREASPAWLGRQRLDIYVPSLNLAIEHQGEQHFRAIAAFGGEDAHARTIERDALKRRLCEENGIALVEIRYDAPITATALRHRLRRFLSRKLVKSQSTS